MDEVSGPSFLDALLGPDGPPALVVAQRHVRVFNPAARRLFGPALTPGAPVLPLFDEESHGKLQRALGAAEGRAVEMNVLPAGTLPQALNFLVAPHGDAHVLLSLGPLREPTASLYEHLHTLLSTNDQLTNLARELSVRTRELSVAREKLEAVSTLREQDAATLSHDLKSPLNALALQAGGLERQADKLTPVVLRERAGAIRRTVRVLLGLVTHVLDGVRLDSGKLALSLEPLSVAEVAGQVVEVLAPVAAQMGVRLVLDRGEGGETEVHADRARLFQAIANLADNALRYSPTDAAVTLRVLRVGGRVRCTVSDQGPGVPPGERELIFERLYQGGRRRGAAGLGLSIARQLVELHGGTLRVENEPGGGARFALDLPVQGTGTTPP